MNIDIIRSVVKFVSGECTSVCRLCLTSDSDGVYLTDSIDVDCEYAKETRTYTEMLADIGIAMDSSLPFMLCEQCAGRVTRCYAFVKRCHNTHSLWEESLQRINTALDVTSDVSSNTETLYLIVGESENIMFTSKKTHRTSDKKYTLNKIRDMVRSKRTYEKVKQLEMTTCSVCGVQVRRRSLRKHQRRHEARRCPCPRCPKVFRSAAHLRDHTERLHRPKRLQCSKCSKMFANEKMLKYHDDYDHTAAICKLCFVQFPCKRTLRQHLNKHDVNQCPHCHKSFLNKQTFKCHLKICGDVEKLPQFFCDICNKGYARKNGLRTHLKTDHGFGTVFTCNWCSKKFDAISRLKCHMVKHTKEKNFICERCNGRFVTQASLTYHMRLHTGEKPFECDLCNERFLSASRRAQHKQRRHLGPRLQCRVCRSRFHTTHQLKTHEARHNNPHSRLYVQHNTIPCT